MIVTFSYRNLEGKLSVYQTLKKGIYRLARYSNPKRDNSKSFEMKFIDSFRFMSSSLDNLVKNLNKDQLKKLKEFLPVERKLNLVIRKGIFPYDYADSITNLAETSLPPKDAFILG